MNKKLTDRQIAEQTVNIFAEEIATVAFERLLKLTHCCPNCYFFNDKMELCVCRNVNARPPARIIAFGCDEYLHKDDMPF